VAAAYKTLGLASDAGAAQARAAYRRLAALAHPDHGGSAEEFRRLNDSYRAVLRDIDHRVCEVCSGTGRVLVTRHLRSTTITCSVCRGAGR
jgi:DnaJ-class molecular chaperone